MLNKLLDPFLRERVRKKERALRIWESQSRKCGGHPLAKQGGQGSLHPACEPENAMERGENVLLDFSCFFKTENRTLEETAASPGRGYKQASLSNKLLSIIAG